MTPNAPDERCRSDAAPSSERRAPARPGLSRDEEVELAARAAAGDRRARDRMVEANLGLVHTIAREFRGRGLELDDLVGEGRLGLFRAVERFDPRFGTRFSTYAAWWIKQAIREALANTTATDPPAGTRGATADAVAAGRAGAGPRAGAGAGFRRGRGLAGARRGAAGHGGPGSARPAGWGRRGLPTRARAMRSSPKWWTGILGSMSETEGEDERESVLRRLERLDGYEWAVVAGRYGLRGEPHDAHGDRPPAGHHPGIGGEDRTPRPPQTRRAAGERRAVRGRAVRSGASLRGGSGMQSHQSHTLGSGIA